MFQVNTFKELFVHGLGAEFGKHNLFAVVENYKANNNVYMRVHFKILFK